MNIKQKQNWVNVSSHDPALVMDFDGKIMAAPGTQFLEEKKTPNRFQFLYVCSTKATQILYIIHHVSTSIYNGLLCFISSAAYCLA